jgi:hypothetical protein
MGKLAMSAGSQFFKILDGADAGMDQLCSIGGDLIIPIIQLGDVTFALKKLFQQGIALQERFVVFRKRRLIMGYNCANQVQVTAFFGPP